MVVAEYVVLFMSFLNSLINHCSFFQHLGPLQMNLEWHLYPKLDKMWGADKCLYDCSLVDLVDVFGLFIGYKFYQTWKDIWTWALKTSRVLSYPDKMLVDL